jgi:hypothetical protein
VRPENLPAVVATRHGNRNSAELQWRNGSTGAERDELWLQLNHGQAVAAEALVTLGTLSADDLWGLSSLNTQDENVWERVYNQPTIVPAAPEAETNRRG